MTQDTPTSEALDKRELRSVIREVLQHEPMFAPSEVEIADAVISHLHDVIPSAIAAELDRMAYDIEMDCDSHSPEIRTYEWIADRVRRRAKQLRGEA